MSPDQDVPLAMLSTSLPHFPPNTAHHSCLSFHAKVVKVNTVWLFFSHSQSCRDQDLIPREQVSAFFPNHLGVSAWLKIYVETWGYGCQGTRLTRKTHNIFFLLDKKKAATAAIFSLYLKGKQCPSGSAKSPGMRLLMRQLGLSFELWSPTEEKVGFSSTVSDRLVKGKKVGNWKKPGQWLRPRGLYLCARVRRRGPRGYDTMRSYFFPAPQWLSSFTPSPKTQKSFLFWHLPAIKAFLNEKPRACLGLSPGAFCKEALYERRYIPGQAGNNSGDMA